MRIAFRGLDAARPLSEHALKHLLELGEAIAGGLVRSSGEDSLQGLAAAWPLNNLSSMALLNGHSDQKDRPCSATKVLSLYIIRTGHDQSYEES